MLLLFRLSCVVKQISVPYSIFISWVISRIVEDHHFGWSRYDILSYRIMQCFGNALRVTCPLWGESTGHRWISFTKVGSAGSVVFFYVSLNKGLNTVELTTVWDTMRPIDFKHLQDPNIIIAPYLMIKLFWFNFNWLIIILDIFPFIRHQIIHRQLTCWALAGYLLLINISVIYNYAGWPHDPGNYSL